MISSARLYRRRLHTPQGVGRGCVGLALIIAWLLTCVPRATRALPPPSGPSGPKRYLTGRLPAHEPRARTVDVQHMALDLTLRPQQRAASGVVTYTGVARTASPTLVLNAVDLRIQSVVVRLDNAEITAPQRARNHQLRLPLRGAKPGARFAVTVRWQVSRPAMGMYFVGPDADEPKRPLHVWTQGETQGARHWLPAPDDPDERLTWRVQITAPKAFRVLSNGEPGGVSAKGGQRVTTFAMSKPYPIYLLNVAAGPYVSARHPHPRVRIESWGWAADRRRLQHIGRATGAMLDHFEALTGTPYPHKRYGHVYVAEFVAGGMENITLTTLTDTAIGTARKDLDWPIDGLLAHELAHQWFGDLVTCRTWADLWLNEGFATFYQKLWTLKAHGIGRFAEEMAGARRGALHADHTPRPVVSDRYRHPSELFDGHAYPKGAWVLHMLRERLGHAVFDAGIKRYLHAHAHHSVETADLRRALEAVSGQSLRGTFRRWLRQPGVPKVTAWMSWDDGKKQLRVRLRQTQTVDGQRPLFALDIPVAVAMAGKVDGQVRGKVRGQVGGNVRRHVMHLQGREATWTTTLPAAPRWAMVDPQMTVLAGWKLRADADLLRGAATLAPHPDARYRAVDGLKGQLHRQPVVATLLRVLRTDKARHVRAAAAKALGAAPRDAVRAGLQRALRRDAEARVRRAAAAALGSLRDSQSVAALRRAAKGDASDGVREASLRALFAIQRDGARPLLLQATGWSSWRARLAGTALMLLARLGDARDLPRLLAASAPGQRKALRARAALALAAYAVRVRSARGAARARLEAMLQDSSRRLRYQAVAGLKTLSLPASRRALLAAADREASFRTALGIRAAAKSLGSKLPVEARIRSLERSLRRLEDKVREGKSRGARRGAGGDEAEGGRRGHHERRGHQGHRDHRGKPGKKP